MLTYIKNKLKSVRSGLTQLNNHPIGKPVFIIVCFLDIFILMSVFQGLSDHTRQLITPYESIPQHCRDMVIDEDWNEQNRLFRIANIASSYRGSYVYSNEKDRVKDQHPVCAPISSLIRVIKDDKALAERLNELLKLRKKSNQINSEFKRTKGSYDTSLLEVIADQNDSLEDTASLKRQLGKLTVKQNKLVEDAATSALGLTQTPSIGQLFNLIETSSTQNRDTLLEDLRSLNFWYPVKRLGMEMIFLLPLILLFYFWNSKSIKSSRPYQTLVSSHLLVVVFIPVIFKVMELIYEIMPKKLLKHVIELLESLNLVAIWHYLMMGAAIFTAMALIYLFQKKIFSHEKLMQKRITKGLCQNCGLKLPGESCACSVCGFKQFRQCEHCKQETYVFGQYCRECGKSE